MFSDVCLDCPAHEFGGCHSDCSHFCFSQFGELCSSCRYNPCLDLSRLPFSSEVRYNPFSDPDMCEGCAVLFSGSSGSVWFPSHYVSFCSDDFIFANSVFSDCLKSIDSKPVVYLSDGDLSVDDLPF